MQPRKEHAQAEYLHPPSDGRLLSLAFRELERRAVRARYLPAELLHDKGWGILLDLLICELQGRTIRVEGVAARWKLSEATATRQIAALIELNLIKRMFANSPDGGIFLRLTSYGREVCQRVLMLLE